MPLYDLRCLSCQKETEYFAKLSELDTAGNISNFICPHCSASVGYQKMISLNTSFHLKGDGWYKDGYSSSTKKENKND